MSQRLREEEHLFKRQTMRGFKCSGTLFQLRQLRKNYGDTSCRKHVSHASLDAVASFRLVKQNNAVSWFGAAWIKYWCRSNWSSPMTTRNRIATHYVDHATPAATVSRSTSLDKVCLLKSCSNTTSSPKSSVMPPTHSSALSMERSSEACVKIEKKTAGLGMHI